MSKFADLTYTRGVVAGQPVVLGLYGGKPIGKIYKNADSRFVAIHYVMDAGSRGVPARLRLSEAKEDLEVSQYRFLNSPHRNTMRIEAKARLTASEVIAGEDLSPKAMGLSILDKFKLPGKDKRLMMQSNHQFFEWQLDKLTNDEIPSITKKFASMQASLVKVGWLHSKIARGPTQGYNAISSPDEKVLIMWNVEDTKSTRGPSGPATNSAHASLRITCG